MKLNHFLSRSHPRFEAIVVVSVISIIGLSLRDSLDGNFPSLHSLASHTTQRHAHGGYMLEINKL